MTLLQIKLIIAAICAALVAYSYVWTYHAGGKAARGECVSEQVQALNKALKEQESKFKDQRQAEMRDAANLSQVLNTNHIRKVKDLEKANEILKRKENEVLASAVVPDDLIIVLNSTRGNISTNT